MGRFIEFASHKHKGYFSNTSVYPSKPVASPSVFLNWLKIDCWLAVCCIKSWSRQVLTEGSNFQRLGIKGVPLRLPLQTMLTVRWQCFVLSQVGYMCLYPSAFSSLLPVNRKTDICDDFHSDIPHHPSPHKGTDRWVLVACTHCYHSRMHALLNS